MFLLNLFFIAAGDVHLLIALLLNVKLGVDASLLAGSLATCTTSLSESLEFELLLLLLEDVCLYLGIGDKIDTLDHLVDGGGALLSLRGFHASIKESLLPSLLDLVDFLHCLQCLHHQISIIARWNISPLLEFKDTIICHFLAVRHSVCLSPLQLAWVLLGLE